MRKEQIKTQKISDNIYRFQEDSSFMNVDAYLILGKERAAVIDGLAIADGLYETVRGITKLPVIMLITHAHPDHAGKGTREFMEAGCEIYLAPEDLPLFEELYPQAEKNKNIHNLKDGMVFDLGGASVRTMSMSGHTAGSVVFFMKDYNIVFSGDAVGSGNIWLQFEYSSRLTDYILELKKFRKFLADYAAVKIYPGHSNQIVPYIKEDQDWLDETYIDDLITVTENIIAGTVSGKRVKIDMPGLENIKIRQAEGKIVKEYCYNEENIR